MIMSSTYTGTFEKTENSNGSVIVSSAKFGTVDTYFVGLLNQYYDETFAKVDTDIAARENDVTDDDTSYKDVTLLESLKKEVSNVSTAITNAEGTQARLAAGKTALANAKEALDKAYAKLVANAKEDAKAGLEKLYAAKANPDTLTGREYMSDADRKAFLEKATAAVEACTTLNAIGKLVGKGTNVENNAAQKGSYNKLEEDRKAVFAKIDEALVAVNGKDSAFDTKAKDTYDTLVETLTKLGFTEEELPLGVANKYRAKVSAAETIDVKALGDEAYKAITDAYDAVLDKLQAQIIKDYDEEFNAYPDTDKNWFTAAHAEVKNLINNWVKMDRETDELGKTFAKVTVSNMLSYVSVKEGTEETPVDKLGGLQYIEQELAKWNVPFTTWRLSVITDEVKAELKAYAKTFTDADAVYASFLTSDKENLLKGTDTDYKYNVTVTAEKWEPTAKTIDGIRGELAAARKEVKKAHADAFEAYLTDWNTLHGVTQGANVATLEGVESLTTDEESKTLLVAAYKNEVKDTKIVAEDFAAVDAWVEKVNAQAKLLNKLVEDVAASADYKAAVDDGMKDDIDETVKAFKKKIVNGEVTTEEEVNNFVKNLGNAHKDAVAAYLVDAKDALEQVYFATLATVSTVDKVKAVGEAYNAQLALATGEKVASKKAIDDWFKAAREAIQAAAK